MAVPTVTSIVPDSGPCGLMVLITGTDFLQDCSQVVFGTYSCGLDYQVISDTLISAIVPNGTGTNVDVKVTTSGGTNSSSTGKFTFHAYTGGGNSIPTVGVCTPGTSVYYSGIGGDSVSIAGTGFVTARKVFFGIVAAAEFTVNSSTSITAIAPQGEGTVYIYVESQYGTSVDADTDNDFTYPVGTLPTVTSIMPANGFPGDTVVITGDHFTEAGATGNDEADAVVFGTLYPDYIIVDDDHIRCDVPGNDSFLGGSVNVYVENGFGRSAAGAAFYYGSATTMVPKTVATANAVPLPKTPLTGWIVGTSQVAVTLTATYAGGPGIESTWYRLDGAAPVRVSSGDSFNVPYVEGSHRVDFWSIGKDGKKEPVNTGYVNMVGSTTVTVNGVPAIGGVNVSWNRIAITGVKYEVLLDTSNPPTTPYATLTGTGFTYKMPYGAAGIYIKVRAVTVDGTNFSYSNVAGPFQALGVDTDDLVDDAIDMMKLALNIRPPRIVSTLPAAPSADGTTYVVGDTCVWTWNNKLYRLGPDDVVPIMTSNTAPSGTASASSIYSASYDAWKAFNHTVGTSGADCWLTVNGTNTGWLKYDFGAGVTKIAKQFAITTRCGSANVATPREFTFYGSNDDSTWIGLLSVYGMTDWATWQGFKRVFDISNNSTAYRYYMLDITVGNLAAYVGMSKLEIATVATPEVGWSSLSYGWDVASGTLTADAIAANTITAGQIAAGAIGAEELAAQSVFARNLVVTDYENLIINSNSEMTLLSGMTSPVPITDPNYEFRGVYGPGAYGYGGVGCCRRITGTGTGNTILFEMGHTKAIPCRFGEQFRFTAKTRCYSVEASYGCRIGILGYDKDGTYVTGEATVSGYNGTTSYADQTVDFEVDHSDVAFVQVRLYFNGAAGNYGYYDNFYFRKKMGGTLIVDGSITADNIGALQITADKIAAGAIWAQNVNVGDYDNLIPNGNSELAIGAHDCAPSSYELDFRGVIAGNQYAGSNCRRLAGTAGGTSVYLALTRPIPVNKGDSYHFEAQAKVGSADGAYGCALYLQVRNSANDTTTESAASTPVHNATSYGPISVDIDIANTSSAWLNVYARVTTSSGVYGYFDNLYLRRKMNGSLIVEGSILASVSLTTPVINGGTATFTVAGSPTKTCTISGSSIVSDNGTDVCTINGGTISGGKMTGTTITGGIIRSAASGSRVEINGTADYDKIFFYGTDTGGSPGQLAVINNELILQPPRNSTYHFPQLYFVSEAASSRVSFNTDLFEVTGKIVPNTDWASATSVDGIFIQESTPTVANRWKLYWDNTNKKLLVARSTSIYKSTAFVTGP